MTNRREFLKALTAITACLNLPIWKNAFSSKIRSDKLGELLPLRPLGNTGANITMLGVGGHHIGGEMSEKEAEATIETAIEGGYDFSIRPKDTRMAKVKFDWVNILYPNIETMFS